MAFVSLEEAFLMKTLNLSGVFWFAFFTWFALKPAYCDDYTLALHKLENALLSSDVYVLQLNGTISDRVYNDLNARLVTLESELEQSHLIVLLNSPGGDGNAALSIGTIFRSLGAHVFVDGRCDSACVFLLAGGAIRGAPGHSVGLHRARIFVEGQSYLNTDSAASAREAHYSSVLAEFEERAASYLSAMGMASKVHETMLRYERRSVYRLALEQLSEYRLIGGASLALRALSERVVVPNGSVSLTDEAILERIRSASLRCIQYSRIAAEFVECYNRQLSRRY